MLKLVKNRKAVEQTKARYNRIAWLYDVSEFLIEVFVFRRWRKRLWSIVPSGHGLEAGVGTGKNIPYYPQNAQITAVDFSPKMLAKAKRRAVRLKANIEFLELNIEDMPFSDDNFDWAVATFVFCSVPDPIRGLEELRRVVKPGGQIFLLEHVRIDKPFIGKWMDFWNPVAVRITGANINRQTVSLVEKSGLNIDRIEDVAPFGAAKLIAAHV